jgi:hypothetical protein
MWRLIGSVSTDQTNWSNLLYSYMSYAMYYGPTDTYDMAGGTTYYFRVVAYDSSNHSATSSVLSYTPQGSATVPVTIQPY